MRYFNLAFRTLTIVSVMFVATSCHKQKQSDDQTDASLYGFAEKVKHCVEHYSSVNQDFDSDFNEEDLVQYQIMLKNFYEEAQDLEGIEALELFDEMYYSEFGEQYEYPKVEYDFNRSGDLVSMKNYDEEDQLISVHTQKYSKSHMLLLDSSTDGEGNVLYENAFEYDKFDNITLQVFQAQGYYTRVESKRDKKGNILSSISTDINGNIVAQAEYKYDEKGNQIEVDSKNQYSSSKELTRYDEKNQPIEILTVSDNGNIRYGSRYSYDDKGNMIKTINICSGGAECGYILSEYDDKGNLLTEKHYDDNNELFSSDEYKYDSKGRQIYFCTKQEDDSWGDLYTSEYDDKGNLISNLSFEIDGTLSSADEYDYDEEGHLTESRSYQGADKVLVTRTVYELDSRGSWISQKVYKTTVKGEEVLTNSRTREIEYY